MYFNKFLSFALGYRPDESFLEVAVSLSRNDYCTALVDADIYGPSIPGMSGIEDIKPYLLRI
jgi:Mrp family chromosome partitioning ATPase